MNDRELLEAAARAVGLEHRGYVDDFFDPEMNVSIGLMYGCPTRVWNPLIDDGDAFRLMVDMDIELSISKELHQNMVFSGIGMEPFNIKVRVEDSDRLTAARRAIVLAAAEMEKT